MNLIFDITVILAAILGATIGFWSAALLINRRQTRLYTRGWNAGREFAIRQAHDHASK